MEDKYNDTPSVYDQATLAKAERLKALLYEVGTHPAVLMIALPRLEEHLSTLADIQMAPDEKKALLDKAKELKTLSTEMGKLPEVKEKALEELQRRTRLNL